MSNPNQQSLAKLKRLARCLKRERQWGQVFEYGKLAEELTVFTDTQAEGHCKEQRRARTLCSSIGASVAKGVQSMMCDLGLAVKPVLAIDAKATEHILHRQGIGKLKHTDVAYLWVQDEIRSQRLRARRVTSEENVADLGTKQLSKAVIAKHCLTLGHTNIDE